VNTYVGLPLSSVQSYELQLSDDSQRTRTGGMLLRGSLVSVRARDATTSVARGTVQVLAGERGYHWGDRLLIRGKLSVYGGSGADWRGSADEGSIRYLGAASHLFLIRNGLRKWVARRLRGLRGEDAALFMALFLGARDDLSGAETYFFRRAGSVHLLALSGFHLGILSFILVGAICPLLGKRRAVAATAVLLCVYLFIAGPKVSLLRAVLMFGLLGVCRLVSIRVRGIDLLGVTFLVCLLAWPASLDTISFQLSYVALGGILVLSPAVERALATRLPRCVRAPVAATIGAMCATAPILAARFGMLYPIGLLSSLVLTPIVTSFLWTGLLYLFIPFPNYFAAILGSFIGLDHDLLSGCAELFARFNPIRVGGTDMVLLCAAALPATAFLLRSVRAAMSRRRGERERLALEPQRPQGEALQ